MLKQSQAFLLTSYKIGMDNLIELLTLQVQKGEINPALLMDALCEADAASTPHFPHPDHLFLNCVSAPDLH